VPEPPILFFDGACGLCARSVAWCLAHDPGGRLRYAPLQGATYAALPHPGRPAELDTVVLLEDGRLWLRSDAVLRVLAYAGGGWAALGTVAGWVPRPLREVAYRFVARRRLGWFGTADACRLPTARERGRFLA
jgi:predicted DCC family thiol-disulfide oxidoreductase YuxK